MHKHEACPVLALGIVLGGEGISLLHVLVVVPHVGIVCIGIDGVLEVAPSAGNEFVLGVAQQLGIGIVREFLYYPLAV